MSSLHTSHGDVQVPVEIVLVVVVVIVIIVADKMNDEENSFAIPRRTMVIQFPSHRGLSVPEDYRDQRLSYDDCYLIGNNCKIT